MISAVTVPSLLWLLSATAVLSQFPEFRPEELEDRRDGTTTTSPAALSSELESTEGTVPSKPEKRGFGSPCSRDDDCLTGIGLSCVTADVTMSTRCGCALRTPVFIKDIDSISKCVRAKSMYESCVSNLECSYDNPNVQCVDALCHCPVPYMLTEGQRCMPPKAPEASLLFAVAPAIVLLFTLLVLGAAYTYQRLSRNKKGKKTVTDHSGPSEIRADVIPGLEGERTPTEAEKSTTAADNNAPSDSKSKHGSWNWEYTCGARHPPRYIRRPDKAEEVEFPQATDGFVLKDEESILDQDRDLKQSSNAAIAAGKPEEILLGTTSRASLWVDRKPSQRSPSPSDTSLPKYVTKSEATWPELANEPKELQEILQPESVVINVETGQQADDAVKIARATPASSKTPPPARKKAKSAQNQRAEKAFASIRPLFMFDVETGGVVSLEPSEDSFMKEARKHMLRRWEHHKFSGTPLADRKLPGTVSDHTAPSTKVSSEEKLSSRSLPSHSFVRDLNMPRDVALGIFRRSCVHIPSTMKLPERRRLEAKPSSTMSPETSVPSSAQRVSSSHASRADCAPRQCPVEFTVVQKANAGQGRPNPLTEEEPLVRILHTPPTNVCSDATMLLKNPSADKEDMIFKDKSTAPKETLQEHARTVSRGEIEDLKRRLSQLDCLKSLPSTDSHVEELKHKLFQLEQDVRNLLIAEPNMLVSPTTRRLSVVEEHVEDSKRLDNVEPHLTAPRQPPFKPALATRSRSSTRSTQHVTFQHPSPVANSASLKGSISASDGDFQAEEMPAPDKVCTGPSTYNTHGTQGTLNSYHSGKNPEAINVSNDLHKEGKPQSSAGPAVHPDAFCLGTEKPLAELSATTDVGDLHKAIRIDNCPSQDVLSKPKTAAGMQMWLGRRSSEMSKLPNKQDTGEPESTSKYQDPEHRVSEGNLVGSSCDSPEAPRALSCEAGRLLASPSISMSFMASESSSDTAPTFDIGEPPTNMSGHYYREQSQQSGGHNQSELNLSSKCDQPREGLLKIAVVSGHGTESVQDSTSEEKQSQSAVTSQDHIESAEADTQTPLYSTEPSKSRSSRHDFGQCVKPKTSMRGSLDVLRVLAMGNQHYLRERSQIVQRLSSGSSTLGETQYIVQQIADQDAAAGVTGLGTLSTPFSLEGSRGLPQLPRPRTAESQVFVTSRTTGLYSRSPCFLDSEHSDVGLQPLRLRDIVPLQHPTVGAIFAGQPLRRGRASGTSLTRSPSSGRLAPRRGGIKTDPKVDIAEIVHSFHLGSDAILQALQPDSTKFFHKNQVAFSGDVHKAETLEANMLRSHLESCAACSTNRSSPDYQQPMAESPHDQNAERLRAAASLARSLNASYDSIGSNASRTSILPPGAQRSTQGLQQHSSMDLTVSSVFAEDMQLHYLTRHVVQHQDLPASAPHNNLHTATEVQYTQSINVCPSTLEGPCFESIYNAILQPQSSTYTSAVHRESERHEGQRLKQANKHHHMASWDNSPASPRSPLTLVQARGSQLNLDDLQHSCTFCSTSSQEAIPGHQTKQLKSVIQLRCSESKSRFRHYKPKPSNSVRRLNRQTLRRRHFGQRTKRKAQQQVTKGARQKNRRAESRPPPESSTSCLIHDTMNDTTIDEPGSSTSFLVVESNLGGQSAASPYFSFEESGSECSFLPHSWSPERTKFSSRDDHAGQ